MAQFKPIMVNNKNDLDTVPRVAGQYIVVINANELYLDKNDAERVKVSQNVYTQAETPTNAKAGDIWFVTEEENI